MNEAIEKMLARYPNRETSDLLQALREILQEVALLGLWRSKFFDKAAFYGGTALRLLYGLDRFSEDLDFSLLRPDSAFKIERYATALEKEIAAFGFDVRLEMKDKSWPTPIQSAFLKADTLKQLMVIQAGESTLKRIPSGQTIKIRLEIDTQPPPDFSTESQFLLLPVPFSVRAYALPDLFAGKMHALLCRRWKNRVKGRDWYDLVWYVAQHPVLHLAHLERRMVQSGHWKPEEPLTRERFLALAKEAVQQVDVNGARKEVEPFIRDAHSLDVWSKPFFLSVLDRIQYV